MSEKRIYFGKKFFKQKDGYWVNFMPIHAHRWVWINNHGAIPKGMDIHHKDGDKNNNEIDNLEMLSRSDHLKRHWEEGRFDLDKRRIQLAEARKWLSTPEGRQKQKEGAIRSAKTRKIFNLQCLNCQKDFESKQSWAKFCHQNCYMNHRRKIGYDKVVKKCIMCDKDFETGKWEGHIFCSISCGAKNSSKHKIRDLGKFL